MVVSRVTLMFQSWSWLHAVVNRDWKCLETQTFVTRLSCHRKKWGNQQTHSFVKARLPRYIQLQCSWVKLERHRNAIKAIFSPKLTFVRGSPENTGTPMENSASSTRIRFQIWLNKQISSLWWRIKIKKLATYQRRFIYGYTLISMVNAFEGEINWSGKCS